MEEEARSSWERLVRASVAGEREIENPLSPTRRLVAPRGRRASPLLRPLRPVARRREAGTRRVGSRL